jgi:hypothetical protein
VLQWLHNWYKWDYYTTVAREHVVALLFILAVSLVVFVQRLRRRMSLEMAALLLYVAILAISPHVFPWYLPVLLLWVPLLLHPLWIDHRLSGSALAILVVWYVVCVSLFQYYYTSGPHHYVPDWTSYYELSYWPAAIVLAIAVIAGVKNMMHERVQKL